MSLPDFGERVVVERMLLRHQGGEPAGGIGAQQLLDRDGGEIRIGDMTVAEYPGEPQRFDLEMAPLAALRLMAADVEVERGC